MKYIYLILALLLIPGASSAGMAVSDSGAYTYWAEQLKKAQDQIKELQSMVSEAQAIKQETMNVYSTLHGNYNRAKGFLDGMDGLIGNIENSPNTTKGQLQKWVDQIDGQFFSDLINPEDVLGAIFTDPRDPEIPLGKTHDQQFNTRQVALRDAIKNADELLESMPDMFVRIKELSEQIDQTENMKDAQDLNNRLLLELVQIQLAQLSMQMQFEKAGALVNYQGVQDDTLKQRAEAVSKAVDEMKAIEWLHDELQAQGIDPDKASFQSLYDWQPQTN